MNGQKIIKELAAYWMSKCESDTIPLRSDLDPTDIPHLLPYVFLMNVTENPRDFYCVLAGEHIITIGRNVTGIYMSQLAQEIPVFNDVFSDCNRVVNDKTLAQKHINFLSPQGIYKSLVYGMFPLGTNDNTLSSMILGCVIFQQKEISQHPGIARFEQPLIKAT